LITREGVFRSTPLVNKIQTALDVSFTQLAELNETTVIANPMFGYDTSPELKSDVFVLMPFSNELQPIYEDHIRVVSGELNLTVARADDFFSSRSIMSDIWSAIYNSRIIIADCTGRNTNVFYEIGIAHTLGRPTILISQNIEDVPFDLRHIRCIVYQYTPRGMREFIKPLCTESAEI
jgi:hypothetical protein